MSLYREIVLHALAQETASGNSGTLETIAGERNIENGRCRVFLDVTAGEGTNEDLNITINAVINGQTHSLGTFTEATGVTKESISLADVPRDIQANWVIGGTGNPKFTFDLRLVRT